MALIGTISGSNGTTTSAVSGSLIIANQPPGSFPSLPDGVSLYVSGAIRLAGDLAVDGGDLTTSDSTFNLVTGSATTVNFAQSATTVAIGAPGGRTTVAHDLAVGTGNIIGAPGAGANVMTLLSSGNIVAKLDVDNNAVGHKFIVQDYTGASQFSVGENGNAELTGSLVVTGSVTALAGFSGSLTKLSDGSNYLLPGSNVSLSTGSNGAVTINAFSTSIFSGIFGDGADGDVTISAGTATLARDMMYNNLTVQNGGLLKPRGYHIYVKGTLTINAGGILCDSGSDGGTGISGGAALTIVSTGFGAASGAGGAGRTTTGVGNAGSTSSNCSANALNQQPQGGVGGAITSPAIAGGTAGAAPQPTILQKWTSLPSMLTARTYNGSATWNGGSGGGGGALDLAGGGTGTSGNGGSGGGIVWIAAKNIVNNGSINANGGAGGNGVTVGSASAGGGAGGGGGLVAIWTTTTTSLGTVTANAGAVGTGSGTAPGAAVLGNAGCIGIIILG